MVVLLGFSYEKWWFYHVLAMNNGVFYHVLAMKNGGFTMF